VNEEIGKKIKRKKRERKKKIVVRFVYDVM